MPDYDAILHCIQMHDIVGIGDMQSTSTVDVNEKFPFRFRSVPVSFPLHSIERPCNETCVPFTVRACSVLFCYGQCERDFHDIYRLHKTVLLLPEARNAHDAAVNRERRRGSERK